MQKRGIDLIVEAFGEINLKYPKLILVVAGPSSKSSNLLSKLKSSIKKYNIAHKLFLPACFKEI